MRRRRAGKTKLLKGVISVAEKIIQHIAAYPDEIYAIRLSGLTDLGAAASEIKKDGDKAFAKHYLEINSILVGSVICARAMC